VMKKMMKTMILTMMNIGRRFVNKLSFVQTSAAVYACI
jgi:hypothetical protein